jgi:hypothetical protein
MIDRIKTDLPHRLFLSFREDMASTVVLQREIGAAAAARAAGSSVS